MLKSSEKTEGQVRKNIPVPLCHIDAGRKVSVITVKAVDGLRGRLSAMGLVPGTQIDVVLSTLTGPFIVDVKGSRVILSQEMALNIIVM